eukprot:CAMPEP_0201516324 /NCGR_PEP_ID=MMETSP0161_2-20130828/7681_1 /ASSEMBLY_ACC=CAM_ASM_000251 /TAXON_ID=180227 /ORGANISM="Neoparamoeba aestuarina, Strain SoJaBio B1-5/56/2" /LENGTH=284 /DNA_ID=CAMNT_0047913411 /DNA_START=104 /DNA_END=954 /DNA_ORIENTATION=-
MIPLIFWLSLLVCGSWGMGSCPALTCDMENVSCDCGGEVYGNVTGVLTQCEDVSLKNLEFLNCGFYNIRFEFNTYLYIENVEFTNVASTSDISFSGRGEMVVKNVEQTGLETDLNFLVGSGEGGAFMDMDTDDLDLGDLTAVGEFTDISMELGNIVISSSDTATLDGNISNVFVLTNVNVEGGSVDVSVTGSFTSNTNSLVGVTIACDNGPYFYANGDSDWSISVDANLVSDDNVLPVWFMAPNSCSKSLSKANNEVTLGISVKGVITDSVSNATSYGVRLDDG